MIEYPRLVGAPLLAATPEFWAGAAAAPYGDAK